MDINIIQLIENGNYFGISIENNRKEVIERLGQPIEENPLIDNNFIEATYDDGLKVTYYKAEVISITVLNKGITKFSIPDFNESLLGFRYFDKKNSLHKLFSFLFSTHYKWKIVHLLSTEESLVIHIEKKIEIIYDLESNEFYKITQFMLP